MALGQVEHGKEDSAPRSPSLEASRNIFATLLCSWLPEHFCAVSASQLLLAQMPSGRSELGFLISICASSGLPLQTLFLVIFPNGIDVQGRMNGKNQEFGSLAISKLVWWLGRGEKADVEEKHSCHSCRVCTALFVWFGFLCRHPDGISEVDEKKEDLLKSSFLPFSSDCAMPTGYTVKLGC